MSDPYHAVAMAAADLAINQPEQYVKLLDTLRDLDKRANEDLHAAGQNEILGVQGQAKAVRKLKTTFENAVATKNKAISERK